MLYIRCGVSHHLTETRGRPAVYVGIRGVEGVAAGAGTGAGAAPCRHILSFHSPSPSPGPNPITSPSPSPITRPRQAKLPLREPQLLRRIIQVLEAEYAIVANQATEARVRVRVSRGRAPPPLASFSLWPFSQLIM